MPRTKLTQPTNTNVKKSAGRPKSVRVVDFEDIKGGAKGGIKEKEKEIILDYSVDNLDAESNSEPDLSDGDAAVDAAVDAAPNNVTELKTSINLNRAIPNNELNSLFSFPVKKKPIEDRKYTPPTVAEIIYFTANNRITSEIMTRYEYCEVVSIRAKQLENSELCFTDAGSLTDPIAIAKKEIADKRCPLRISRCICDNKYELWDVNEMAIPIDMN